VVVDVIPRRAPKKGKSKYFAKKTEYDGIVFDSKLEAARYKILKGYQEAGEITDLEVQVDFPCVITVEGEDKKICSYVADFRYKRDGEVVVEDTKGIITQVFTLKKKLVEALYPGLKILIIKDPREWA
jgi:hypothetical protein